jgi:ubiquinone/menaquinone biosynthesis C-methylase UbiE
MSKNRKGLKTMTHTERTYLPAAGHDWTLPLYDPFVKLLGGDRVRSALLHQAALEAGHRVLDIGCGTGSLAVLIKRSNPNVKVVGLDPDPKALARARRKADLTRMPICFDRGFADELPYPDASFDRVFSSFMFHHLEAGQKVKTLREARRVLAPGGSLHLLDLARPEEQRTGWWDRLVYSNPHLKDNSDNRILTLLRECGFESAKKVKDAAIFLRLLHVSYYEASVPGADLAG